MESSGWVMGGSGSDDPQKFEELRRRRSMPDNEVPVGVADVLTLVRTPDAAVFVSAWRIFSTGVAFSLTTVTRTGSEALQHRFGPSGATGGGLLVGVELTDGRRASTRVHRWPGTAEPPSPDDVTLSTQGGGGSDRRLDQDFFLSPVPPDGSMTLYIVWPDLRLDQSSVTISTDGWTARAASITPLWTPEPPRTWEPPEPPEPPAGTWFAQS